MYGQECLSLAAQNVAVKQSAKLEKSRKSPWKDMKTVIYGESMSSCQISTVQPSGTQIWTSSPRSWTLSPAFFLRNMSSRTRIGADRSAKVKHEVLYGIVSAFLIWKMSAYTSARIKAVSASCIQKSFLQRMPFRCSQLCLKLCCLNVSDSQVQRQILDAEHGKGCCWNEWMCWHLGKYPVKKLYK